jgi:hypothetical protein
LRKAICKYPTEFDRGNIDARYGYIKNEEYFKKNSEAWGKLRAHISAMTMDDLPSDYKAAQWHFHPLEFVRVMRMCGWLSKDEFAQLLPRAGVNGAISTWTAAKRRLTEKFPYLDLNRVFRKYGFTTANRQTAFLAQAYIETLCLLLVEEGGKGTYTAALPMTQYYAAFYGRGVMQLTWAGTYADYGKYRGFPAHTGAYADTRITATSTHDWAAPTRNEQQVLVRNTRQWFPRFDPDILVRDTYNACDSGAFFWISKHFTGVSNINRLADEGITPELIGRMSILVNGGGNGYNERLQYAAFVARYRFDGVDAATTGTVATTRQRISHGHWVTGGQAITVTVNFTPQRP